MLVVDEDMRLFAIDRYGFDDYADKFVYKHGQNVQPPLPPPPWQIFSPFSLISH
ncbi:hypothetical protein ACSS6W_001741 [Trichoderma asperelloides]